MGPSEVQHQFCNSAIFLTRKGGGAEVPPPSLYYRQLEQGSRKTVRRVLCQPRLPEITACNLTAAGVLSVPRISRIDGSSSIRGGRAWCGKPLFHGRLWFFLGNAPVVWGNLGAVSRRGKKEYRSRVSELFDLAIGDASQSFLAPAATSVNKVKCRSSALLGVKPHSSTFKLGGELLMLIPGRRRTRTQTDIGRSVCQREGEGEAAAAAAAPPRSRSLALAY
jgi:hypothetical protein